MQHGPPLCALSRAGPSSKDAVSAGLFLKRNQTCCPLVRVAGREAQIPVGRRIGRQLGGTSPNIILNPKARLKPAGRIGPDSDWLRSQRTNFNWDWPFLRLLKETARSEFEQADLSVLQSGNGQLLSLKPWPGREHFQLARGMTAFRIMCGVVSQGKRQELKAKYRQGKKTKIARGHSNRPMRALHCTRPRLSKENLSIRRSEASLELSGGRSDDIQENFLMSGPEPLERLAESGIEGFLGEKVWKVVEGGNENDSCAMDKGNVSRPLPEQEDSVPTCLNTLQIASGGPEPEENDWMGDWPIERQDHSREGSVTDVVFSEEGKVGQRGRDHTEDLPIAGLNIIETEHVIGQKICLGAEELADDSSENSRPIEGQEKVKAEHVIVQRSSLSVKDTAEELREFTEESSAVLCPRVSRIVPGGRIGTTAGELTQWHGETGREVSSRTPEETRATRTAANQIVRNAINGSHVQDADGLLEGCREDRCQGAIGGAGSFGKKPVCESEVRGKARMNSKHSSRWTNRGSNQGSGASASQDASDGPGDWLDNLVGQLLRASNPSMVARAMEQGLPPGRPVAGRHVASVVRRLGEVHRPRMALQVWEWWREHGSFRLDVRLVTLIMSVLGRGKLIREAMDVLEDMQASGCRMDAAPYNVLITALGRAGKVDKALEVFCRMEASHGMETVGAGCRPTVVTYGALIMGLSRGGRVREARGLLSSMGSKGCSPNAILFNTLITACGRAGDLAAMEALVREMRGRGIVPDAVTYTALMHAYQAKGLHQQVADTWHEMKVQGNCAMDTMLYTTAIAAEAKLGRVAAMETAFAEMQSLGLQPDEVTYAALLEGFARCGDRARMDAIWQSIIGPREEIISSAVLSASAAGVGSGEENPASKQWAETDKSFDLPGVGEVECPQSTDQSGAASCKAQRGAAESDRVLGVERVFRPAASPDKVSEPRTQGKAQQRLVPSGPAETPNPESTTETLIPGAAVRPTTALFNIVLRAYAKFGALSLVEGTRQAMADQRCDSNKETYEILVAAYSCHGLVGGMEQAVREMQAAGFGLRRTTFNAILAGYAGAGLIAQMEDTFRLMQAGRFRPNAATWRTLAAAYEKAGMWKAASQVYLHLGPEGESHDDGG